MNSKEQITQEQAEAVAAGEAPEKAAKQTAVQNKRKKKIKIEISLGKILALLFVMIAIIYFVFSTSVFWNFIRIMNNEKDAADRQGAAAEVLDDNLTGEDE